MARTSQRLRLALHYVCAEQAMTRWLAAGRMSVLGGVASLALSACGGKSTGEVAPLMSPAASGSTAAPAAQPLKSACEWLSRAEVEAVLGKLAGEPRLARNAQNPRADEEGSACVYPVGTDRGVVDVALEVDPRRSGAGHDEPGAPAKRADGWDAVSGVPGLVAYRQGHVAITLGIRSIAINSQTLDHFALAARERIADLPIAAPGADPHVVGGGPDPCALIARAEAEAVLGKLAVAPFRSRESSPLAEGDGPSCTYYTAGHHALVITPTRSNGKMMFDMAGGAELHEGPWDRATSGSNGALYFLKTDKLLEVMYRTSSTDRAGAARLAAVAIPRL